MRCTGHMEASCGCCLRKRRNSTSASAPLNPIWGTYVTPAICFFILSILPLGRGCCRIVNRVHSDHIQACARPALHTPARRTRLCALFHHLLDVRFYWSINLGALVSYTLVSYICQFGLPFLGGADWGFMVGYSIPCVAVALAIGAFVAGTPRSVTEAELYHTTVDRLAQKSGVLAAHHTPSTPPRAYGNLYHKGRREGRLSLGYLIREHGVSSRMEQVVVLETFLAAHPASLHSEANPRKPPASHGYVDAHYSTR